MKWSVALAVVTLLVVNAHADRKAPTNGFWNVLVKPGAKWVLHETGGDSKCTITIETYDARKVAGADVARLRWTNDCGGKKVDVGASESGRYTQLAVTAAGLYILSADMNDDLVAKALAKKPSRSDPPKAYKGTKQNHGRYLTVNDDGSVIMGEGPMPGDGECPDTCDGSIRISRTAGITQLMGTWAPGVSVFEQ